jgi:hypothetical protein
MITMNSFLTNILKNILDVPIVSPEYKSKYGISRNSFTYYIRYNKKLSKKLSDALIQIILDNIKDDKYKKDDTINYLSAFLTEPEKKKAKTVEDIIKTGVLKFTATTNKNKNKIRVVSYKDVLAMQLDIKDIVSEAMQLNSETMEGLTLEHSGYLQQWVDIAHESPDTYRYLFDSNNNIVGVWSFFPVFREVFEKIKEGKFFDNELTLDMMPVLFPGIYDIYFVEICLDNKYRGTAVFRLLLKSIANILEKLATKKIFINEICTQAYTADGERLCKSLGLKYYKKHIDCGNIYCGTIKDLLKKPFCKDYYTLKNSYTKEKLIR